VGAAGLVLLALGGLLSTLVRAQELWPPWGRFNVGPRMATPDSFDGSFQFCRGMYRRNPRGVGGGWSTDYPSADINLSIRFAELTKAPVSRDASGRPNHLVVRVTDPELFRCPFLLMSEVGAVYFDEEEAARLREYFLKGGFLWVDDFWGSYAWNAWEQQISKVFPPGEYPIQDVPPDHVLFRTLFELAGVPQVPSINFWLGSGGSTSERGVDSSEVHARAIFDDRGRIMVFMTHNTDIADSWEREGEDPDYFYRFSVNGYALAVNVLLYAMTR
jgi:hypothetical protein